MTYFEKVFSLTIEFYTAYYKAIISRDGTQFASLGTCIWKLEIIAYDLTYILLIPPLPTEKLSYMSLGKYPELLVWIKRTLSWVICAKVETSKRNKNWLRWGTQTEFSEFSRDAKFLVSKQLETMIKQKLIFRQEGKYDEGNRCAWLDLYRWRVAISEH